MILFLECFEEKIVNVGFLPYLHVAIAALSHAILFGSLVFSTGGYAADYMQDGSLSSSLFDPLILQVRVASLAISAPLIIEFFLELIPSHRKRNNEDTTMPKSSSSRAELAVRYMFLVSFIEPNVILLSIPTDNYNVIMAYATTYLQNILVFCGSMFLFSITFDKTTCMCGRSLLLSLIHTFAQVVNFFVSIFFDPREYCGISIFSMAVANLPPILYLIVGTSYVRILWVKMKVGSTTDQIIFKEYLFLANYTAIAVWVSSRIVVYAYFRKLYLFQYSVIDLVIFNVPIILFAVMASNFNSWSARLGSREAQAIISTTKRKIQDDLTHPLLEISIGLNLLLAASDSNSQSDMQERMTLSRIAGACNKAVNTLNSMALNDDQDSQLSDSARSWLGDLRWGSIPRNVAAPNRPRRRPRHTQFSSTTDNSEQQLGSGKMDSLLNSDYFDSEISEIQEGRQEGKDGKHSSRSLGSTQSGASRGKTSKRPSLNVLASNSRLDSFGRNGYRPQQRVFPENREYGLSLYPSRSDDGKMSDKSTEEKSTLIDQIPVSSACRLPRPYYPAYSNSAESTRELVHRFSSITDFGDEECDAGMIYPFAPTPHRLTPLRITPIRVLTPLRAITPVRGSTPVRVLTPPRCLTPLRFLTPLRGIKESPTYIDVGSDQWTGSVDIRRMPSSESDSCPTSMVSAAMSTQLFISPWTPLQFYSSMPDERTSGFACPFSQIVPSNHTLVNLLSLYGIERSIPSKSDAPSSSSTKLGVHATHRDSHGTNSSIINSKNVSKKVLVRCLVSLANDSFSSICLDGTSPPSTYPQSNNASSTLNRPEKCDMLSEFTWKLVENFYVNMKSTLNVFDVLISSFDTFDSFSPTRGHNKNYPSSGIGSRSPLHKNYPDIGTEYRAAVPESRSTVPSVFEHPTVLTYNDLCELDEYLSGVQQLFVKASSSLLTVADNVSVMKERRKRGFF